MRHHFLLPFILVELFQPLGAQEAPDQFLEPGAREENYAMKVTARVIDENGNPMANTPIRIGIHNVNDYKDMYNDFRGVTDAEGKFSAEGIGRGLAKIDVEKEGHYPSHKTVTCYDGTPERIREAERFFPWDPVVDIMVKKIGKPIPMIVRLADGGTRSRMKPSPEMLGRDLGWDLVEGDWTAPNGNGQTADLTVRFESDFIDESNRLASVVVRFGNPDDGFIPITELKGEASLLKFPRMAAEDGYGLRELRISQRVEDGAFDAAPKKNPEGYIFRLRTKIGDSGQVKSAIYGKITKPFELQDIVFRGDNRLSLEFDYYLNLTPNDRNLEYDQKTNLAPEADKDLRWPP